MRCWAKLSSSSSMDAMPSAEVCQRLARCDEWLGHSRFTLTGLVCTLPPNLYGDIHKLYEQEVLVYVQKMTAGQRHPSATRRCWSTWRSPGFSVARRR